MMLEERGVLGSVDPRINVREWVIPGSMILIFGLMSLSLFSQAASAETGVGLAFSIVGGFVALFLALAVVAAWVGVEFWTRL